MSARALGVGTAQCLRDYFRLGPRDIAVVLRNWSRKATLMPVRIGGWHRPGLFAQGRPPAPQDQGARPAGAVRSAGFRAHPHRKTVRFPLPHRDLHAGGEAPVRLLRAAVPAGRPHRRPRRPEGRPPEQRVARAGGLCRTRRAGGDGCGTAGGVAADAALAGAGEDGSGDEGGFGASVGGRSDPWTEQAATINRHSEAAEWTAFVSLICV